MKNTNQDKGRIGNVKAGLESEQTKSLPHVHEWERSEKVVPLHQYVIERGKIVKDLITGKDTLKQFKCKCGKVETADLERKKR